MSDTRRGRLPALAVWPPRPTCDPNDPQPGYWLMQLVKGGPRVAACIRIVHTTHEPGNPSNLMERSSFIAAFINGEPADLARVWLWHGEPITKAEHDFRVAEARWAKKHKPDEPVANPRRPIDLLQAPLPF
jgi:hypothetical protein